MIVTENGEPGVRGQSQGDPVEWTAQTARAHFPQTSLPANTPYNVSEVRMLCHFGGA